MIKPNYTNGLFQKVILRENNLIENLTKFFTMSQLLEFYSYLNDDVILSGSFILSTILNESYANNDLDIYIDNKIYYQLISKFLINCNYILSKSQKTKYKYNFNMINCVDTFINTENKNIHIDLIYCKNNRTLIREYFDLDIVKNYYNGSNFYVFDVTKLLYKHEYIHEYKLTKKIKDRIDKYRNRGFTITILYD